MAQSAIASKHRDVCQAFESHKTRPYEYRISQLKSLERMIEENMEDFVAAVMSDLGRSDFEARVEMLNMGVACQPFYKDLKKWIKPEPKPCWTVFAPASAEIRNEPLGVALIIGPFNFPIMLLLKPLLGAIAAGCCAIIKPSERTPKSAATLEKYLPMYLDQDCYKVVTGGVPETKQLLDLRWDHIFFTGSTHVAKIVAAAAAKHLTPCTLECGGKNAAYVDSSVDSIEVVARRIVWARTVNCGMIEFELSASKPPEQSRIAAFALVCVTVAFVAIRSGIFARDQQDAQ